MTRLGANSQEDIKANWDYLESIMKKIEQIYEPYTEKN